MFAPPPGPITVAGHSKGSPYEKWESGHTLEQGTRLQHQPRGTADMETKCISFSERARRLRTAGIYDTDVDMLRAAGSAQRWREEKETGTVRTQ